MWPNAGLGGGRAREQGHLGPSEEHCLIEVSLRFTLYPLERISW
jgi:hypothetical protein